MCSRRFMKKKKKPETGGKCCCLYPRAQVQVKATRARLTGPWGEGAQTLSRSNSRAFSHPRHGLR